MTRCVLVDLGGVLFRFDPRPRLRVLAAASPLSELQIEGALWGSGLAEDADRGFYDARQQVAESQSRAKVSLDYGEMRDAWVRAFEPDRDVEALVARLRPDLLVGLFSNNSELIRFGLEAAWPDLMGRFTASIWAYEARALKPSAEAYRYAERRLRAMPEQMCLIDDNADNVAGARAAGWDAIQFTDAAALAAALDERGLLRA